ncbi:amidase [Variovorax gossypii]
MIASKPNAAFQSLARAHAAEPALLAWSHLADAAALESAADGPLRGWALGVKDNINVAGMPTRCGSAASSRGVYMFDASVVAQLRAAGAVPIGKTVTTEFAYATPGATRNPWQPMHTPGGSSSGSAAAVAAGVVPIALGTQTGGSMIRPAAFCGVVGFKPSAGLVSREGMHLACESLDVIGWYGASVEHAQAVGNVLLPSSRTRARKLEDLRVAWLDANPGHRMQQDAAAALSAAAGHLVDHVARVRRMTEFSGHAELLEAHSTLMHYEFSRSLEAVVRADRGRLSAPLLDAVCRGREVEGDAYVAARQLQVKAQQSWEAHFEEADLVLTSSVLGTAPEGLRHTGDSAFNKGWSVLGWPCVHLPTTLATNGLPLGVLLVARPCCDLDLLEWARKIHEIIDQRSCEVPPVFHQPKVKP